MNKFKKPFKGARNLVLDKDGNFYISYNPKIEKHWTSDYLVSIGEAADRAGLPETALVLKDNKYLFGKGFFILNGDFRKEYEEAFPDLKKCIAVYKKNKAKHNSDYSNKETL